MNFSCIIHDVKKKKGFGNTTVFYVAHVNKMLSVSKNIAVLPYQHVVRWQTFCTRVSDNDYYNNNN